VDKRHKDRAMSAVLVARASDTAWFAAHPDRRIRVRLLAPGECGEADAMQGDCLKAMVLYRFVPGKIAAWVVCISGLPEDTEDDAQELLVQIGRRTGPIRADA
jgi:hypothetical protein